MSTKNHETMSTILEEEEYVKLLETRTLYAIVTQKLLNFLIDNEDSLATPEHFFKDACEKLKFNKEDAEFLEAGYNDMAKKCGQIGIDEEVIPANKLTVEQGLHLDEFCKMLHADMPQKLLNFLIYNEEPFSKSEGLFEAACEKLEIIEKCAKFLEIIYNEMGKKRGLVERGNVIPANKLTIEQKLDLADAEKFDMEARFVKEYFLKKRTEDIITKIRKTFISDNVAPTEKSSSAKKYVGAKNSRKSLVSTNQKGASATSTPVAKRDTGKSKNHSSSSMSDPDFK